MHIMKIRMETQILKFVPILGLSGESLSQEENTCLTLTFWKPLV